MGNISKLTDSSESNGRHICYHDVYVKAHHVEMENVLGSGWVESGDGKCKAVWTFVFHDDNGESFPACVYDWKEYGDYYRYTNHDYHIGTQTTLQSKLVAEYIESRIMDFMKITKSQFYFDKPTMVRKIKEAILTYCICHSDAEVSGATMQIYKDGEIKIGTDVKISAKNVFEPVMFLLKLEAISKGIIECDMGKIERLVDNMSSYFYYQYLNSIQSNRE